MRPPLWPYFYRLPFFPAALRRKALGRALEQENLPLVAALVHEENINISVLEGSLTYPLEIAIKQGNVELVELLLVRGANPNAAYAWGGVMTSWIAKTPFHGAPEMERWQAIGRLLLRYGGDFEDGLVPKGISALHDILKISGRLDVVRALVDQHRADQSAEEIDQGTVQVSASKLAARL